MKHSLKIVIAMIIWSTWGLMIRWLALPPVVVLFYVSLIAGIAVPLFLRLRGELDLSGAGDSWRLFAALAAASITNNITYFYSLGHTTVANAVFTHYTAPIIVAVLAPHLIAERIRKVTLISLPVAAAGMALVVVSGGGLTLAGEHLSGIAAGTASGIAYAFLILISRKLSRMLMHHKAIVILLWITAIVTAPAALTAEHGLSVRTMVLLLVGGLVHSTIASLLYYNALRQVIAQHAAILGYLEPLFAIPLAFLFLSETPSLAALAGGILILVSGYLVVRSGRNEVERAAP